MFLLEREQELLNRVRIDYISNSDKSVLLLHVEFLSSTEDDTINVWIFYLLSNSIEFSRISDSKTGAYSVHYLKDN